MSILTLLLLLLLLMLLHYCRVTSSPLMEKILVLLSLRHWIAWIYAIVIIDGAHILSCVHIVGVINRSNAKIVNIRVDH